MTFGGHIVYLWPEQHHLRPSAKRKGANAVSRVAKNGKTTVLRKTNAFLFSIQHFASLAKTDPSWGVYKEFESGANKQILFKQ